jgi:hypothetical protein
MSRVPIHLLTSVVKLVKFFFFFFLFLLLLLLLLVQEVSFLHVILLGFILLTS